MNASQYGPPPGLPASITRATPMAGEAAAPRRDRLEVRGVLETRKQARHGKPDKPTTNAQGDVEVRVAATHMMTRQPTPEFPTGREEQLTTRIASVAPRIYPWSTLALHLLRPGSQPPRETSGTPRQSSGAGSLALMRMTLKRRTGY